MKVKLLEKLSHPVAAQPGDVVDVSEAHARHLEAHGYAEFVSEPDEFDETDDADDTDQGKSDESSADDGVTAPKAPVKKSKKSKQVKA